MTNRGQASAAFVWAIGMGLAVVMGLLLVELGSGPILKVLGSLLVSVVVLRASEKALPLIVILTLALGSSYRWDVVNATFYLRFFVLFLVAFRGVALFFEAKRQGKLIRSSPSSPLHWLILALAIMGLVSSVDSVDPWLSVQRALTFLLLFFVVFIYFWLRSETGEICRKYGVSLWWTLVILLAVGFTFLLFRVPGMFRGGRLRLILLNPNILGHYCAMMSPIAIWVLMQNPISGKKFLKWGALGALFVAIIWSGSRGGIITATSALLVQCLLVYRKYLVAVVLAVIFVFSVHILMGDPRPDPGADDTFVSQYLVRSESLGTGSGRTEIWKAAWTLIDRRPLFGYGFAVTDQLFERGYFPTLPDFQGGHVHNAYLEELVNLGWIGSLPLFLAISYTLLVGFLALLRPVRMTENYAFSVALFAVVLAGTISGIFEAWFTSVGSVFCFPFFFASIFVIKMVRNFNDWSAIA